MRRSPILRSRRTDGACSSWPRKSSMSCSERAAPSVRIINAVQTLHVDVGHSRYPITIGSGLLTNRELLEQQIPGRDLLVVTNATVAKLYLAKFTGSFAQRHIGD